MKTYIKIFSILFTAIIAAGVVSLPAAAAEQGSCVLQATDDNVYIIIYDLSSDGSRGSQIWEGRLNAGQSTQITTPHQQFVYYYNSQPGSDQPLSGGTERWCNNNEVILVP